MAETPIAEWGMKGTVADKGAAFRQLADEVGKIGPQRLELVGVGTETADQLG